MDDIRLRYLESMGIPVWVPRDAADSACAPPGLHLGPGDGPCLLVCADAAQSARQLATDIARCLPRPAAWAWPTDEAGAPSLEDAVAERLFTAVLIFGKELAQALLVGKGEGLTGTAQVHTFADLDAMTASWEQRRDCWQKLKEAGLGLAITEDG